MTETTTSFPVPDWQPRPLPPRVTLEGRHVRLEPLDIDRHGEDLFLASRDGGERFRWLWEVAPASMDDFRPWLEKAAKGRDPLFYAVIDRATGRAGGRQALMRIDAANGVIEIGSIYWGPAIARRPAATEAFYLFARHVFDDLGYRRLEWKCNADNLASRRAALRFGMTEEGVFRQHMVVKGQNRDTAWFSLLDREWPAEKAVLEAWLDPANFRTDGQQIDSLASVRERSRS